MTRIVEAQHVSSTLKLVDSLDEQELLEQMIDSAKPLPPSGPEFQGLHFLLWTPFRYPPLRNGSRFGSKHERSLWYGSGDVQTALTERAYWELIFLAGPEVDLSPIDREWSCFHVDVRTERGVDLTRAPFSDHEACISSRTSYADSQSLGAEMRAAGVVGFKFKSARAPGWNVGLFEPAFASPDVADDHIVWRCRATRQQVQVTQKNLSAHRQIITFTRQQFEVAGGLPAPGLVPDAR